VHSYKAPTPLPNGQRKEPRATSRIIVHFSLKLPLLSYLSHSAMAVHIAVILSLLDIHLSHGHPRIYWFSRSGLVLNHGSDLVKPQLLLRNKINTIIKNIYIGKAGVFFFYSSSYNSIHLNNIYIFYFIFLVFFSNLYIFFI
jgi:hypothetical protein